MYLFTREDQIGPRGIQRNWFVESKWKNQWQSGVWRTRVIDWWNVCTVRANYEKDTYCMFHATWELRQPHEHKQEQEICLWNLMLRQLKWQNLHVGFYLPVSTAKQIVLLFVCQILRRNTNWQHLFQNETFTIHSSGTKTVYGWRLTFSECFYNGGMLLDVPAELQGTFNMLVVIGALKLHIWLLMWQLHTLQ